MCECDGENVRRDKNLYSDMHQREREREREKVWLDSIIDREKGKDKLRGREEQFGLRIRVKGTRHEETNK